MGERMRKTEREGDKEREAGREGGIERERECVCACVRQTYIYI